jgi:hypothetical protein
MTAAIEKEDINHNLRFLLRPASAPAGFVQSTIMRGRYLENTPLEVEAAIVPKYQQPYIWIGGHLVMRLSARPWRFPDVVIISRTNHVARRPIS